MNSLEFNIEAIRATGKPLIFVDDRELKSKTARHLFELGAKLNPVRLDVGDFIPSPRVAIERKLAADFESSVIDGRLFNQAKELVENFESPMLCIVGEDFERIPQKAIRGATISLLVDFKLPLMFFKEETHLAEFIYHVAEREQLRDAKEQKLRFGKKGFTLAQKQQFIVESLPMIGPNAAKKLLEHFQSVERIAVADEKELQEVDLIGKEKAKEIRSVLTTKYATELGELEKP